MIEAQGATMAQASAVVAMPVTSTSVPVSNVLQSSVRLGSGDEPERLEPVTWASEPIRIGVLDFRVAGDASESQSGAEAAGTGTAIADVLAEALGHDTRFQVIRIDLRSGSRNNIAEAVRAGHGQDVDAVLVGELTDGMAAPQKTLLHLSKASLQPESPVRMRLRAGLIDTHSGALLVQMDAETDADAAAQVRFAAQHVLASFDQMQMAQKTDAGLPEPDGKVLSANGVRVRVKLLHGQSARPGEQWMVRSQGLTKDLATGTLTVAHNTRAGFLRVDAVSGDVVDGSFDGPLLPKAGDAVLLVRQP